MATGNLVLKEKSFLVAEVDIKGRKDKETQIVGDKMISFKYLDYGKGQGIHLNYANFCKANNLIEANEEENKKKYLGKTLHILSEIL